MTTFFLAQQLRKVLRNQKAFKLNQGKSGLTQNNRTQIRTWAVLAYMPVYINPIILKPVIGSAAKRETKAPAKIYKKLIQNMKNV